MISILYIENSKECGLNWEKKSAFSGNTSQNIMRPVNENQIKHNFYGKRNSLLCKIL